MGKHNVLKVPPLQRWSWDWNQAQGGGAKGLFKGQCDEKRERAVPQRTHKHTLHNSETQAMSLSRSPCEMTRAVL